MRPTKSPATWGGLGPLLMLGLSLLSTPTHATPPDFLSAQGYSGLGLIPSGRSLEAGRVSLDYGKAIPGSPSPEGHTIQLGFGLMPGLELVGRIATQDLHCNMFKVGACPPNQIRDFAASVKWSPRIPALESMGLQPALGMNDVGGAAARFKSYYAVASQSLGPFTLHLGAAQSKGDLSILNGAFFGADVALTEGIKLSVQKVTDHQTLTVGMATPRWLGGYGTFQYHRRLDDKPGLPTDWIAYGVSLPLDGFRYRTTPLGEPIRVAHAISPLQVEEALERRGFYRPHIDLSTPQLVRLELENTGYLHDPLDAAGVALGVIAGAYGRTEQLTRFDLLITQRGIGILRVQGSARCVLNWMNLDQPCDDLQLSSALQDDWSTNPMERVSGAQSILDRLLHWRPRPELQASPVITSAVATEYGWLDADVGMNYNAILPLWRGAQFEVNRLEPLDLRHDSFEPRGVFYAARLRSGINRRMFHQVVSLPGWNTQLRLTRGMAYTNWRGWQFESQTFSPSGRHRISSQVGRFDHDNPLRNPTRRYELYTYRYAFAGYPSLSAELTYGEYWNGDRGYTVSQTFWNGDTSVSIYLRQSRYSGGPEASFAGIAFSVPMTPRKNRGWRYFGLRGASQWTYSLETRVFDKDNRIGGGYGVVPRMGDSMVQTFNRDRNSTEYFQANQWRLLDAFRAMSYETP